MKSNTLDTGLFANSFPTNPIPFMLGLQTHLLMGGLMTDPKAKRILYVLIAQTRGQFARIPLDGNAIIHREDLARMHRSTPEDAIKAMIREASDLGTEAILSEWKVSIASLIYFAYGDTGRLDLCDEWKVLLDTYSADQPA